MVKKTIAIVLVTLLAMTTFFSCSGQGDETAAADIPAYDPEKEYTVSIGAYGDLERAYMAVMETDDFKRTFPNVTVEFQTADFGGHHSRLTTVIAAGEATNDIEALEVGYIAKFVEGGGLTDLSAEPFNGFEVGDEIVEFAMSNATTEEGALVAMPVDIAPAVLFYRQSLVDEAGISLENLASWDEFIEKGKELTVDRDGDGTIDQYAIPNANEVAMTPLNGGKGGWFDEDDRPLQPKEKFITALNVVRRIREAGIDGDLTAWTGPWTQSFADGTVAATVNGAWFGGALKTWIATDLAGDWRATRLPGNTLAALGGTYLTIPENVSDEQKAVAWEVITYLTTNGNAQITTFETIDAYPALTAVYDDPIMDEPVDYFGGQKVRQLYAEIARDIPNAAVSEYDAAVLSIFSNAITDVLVNDVGTEDAYQNAVNSVLAIAD
ncbi:MAG: extracellular solute-binding protein [Spirochaeta sp.]|jgi:multiple sugar transport system substrate-binding protein|nr:extracellular solute-binding protein [Spirochaeta sp.]